MTFKQHTGGYARSEPHLFTVFFLLYKEVDCVEASSNLGLFDRQPLLLLCNLLLNILVSLEVFTNLVQHGIYWSFCRRNILCQAILQALVGHVQGPTCNLPLTNASTSSMNVALGMTSAISAEDIYFREFIRADGVFRGGC